MGISPGLQDDCKAIAVRRLCVLSGMLYFHNLCTVLEPIQAVLCHISPQTPLNSRALPRGLSSTLEMCWRGRATVADRRKTFCVCLPTKPNNTWWTGTTDYRYFCPCFLQNFSERCWICVFRVAEVCENCWGVVCVEIWHSIVVFGLKNGTGMVAM